MVPAVNACFLMGKIAQVGIMTAAGFITLVLIQETLLLAFVAVTALWFGQRIQEKIDVITYRKILHGLLLVLALILFAQYFGSL